MVRKRLTNPDWAKKQLQKLLDVKKTLDSVNVYNYVDPKYGTWTLKKLIVLMNYVPPYTRIIGKKVYDEGMFDNYYYIDLLAGSGANIIRKESIPGSAILSYWFSERPFSEYIFLDIKRDRVDALHTRLEKMKGERYSYPPKYFPCVGDCNRYVDSLLPKIKDRRSPSFVFIDPEGFEVEWNTVQKLLEANPSVEILYTFMTSQLIRCAEISRTHGSVTRFIGDDGWKEECHTPEDFVDYFVRKIRPYYRQNVVTIPVERPSGHLLYHMIFATKSPAAYRIMDYIKGRVTKLKSKDLKGILDVLAGKQKALTDYVDSLFL